MSSVSTVGFDPSAGWCLGVLSASSPRYLVSQHMAHWDQTVGHCRAVDDSLVRAELIPLSLDPVALVFDSLGGGGTMAS